MNWIWPYIVPLFVAAILARRLIREQKPRTVRMGRLWLMPSLLLLVTLTALNHEPMPGFIASVVFVLAIGLGGLIGWYRVHTLEFARDAETGKITSRGSQFDTLIVLGLIALRYGLDAVLKNVSLAAGPGFVRASDTMLLFTTAMFVARSAHTFVRARALTAPAPTNTVGPPLAADLAKRGVYATGTDLRPDGRTGAADLRGADVHSDPEVQGGFRGQGKSP